MTKEEAEGASATPFLCLCLPDNCSFKATVSLTCGWRKNHGIPIDPARSPEFGKAAAQFLGHSAQPSCPSSFMTLSGQGSPLCVKLRIKLYALRLSPDVYTLMYIPPPTNTHPSPQIPRVRGWLMQFQNNPLMSQNSLFMSLSGIFQHRPRGCSQMRGCTGAAPSHFMQIARARKRDQLEASHQRGASQRARRGSGHPRTEPAPSPKKTVLLTSRSWYTTSCELGPLILLPIQTQLCWVTHPNSRTLLALCKGGADHPQCVTCPPAHLE